MADRVQVRDVLDSDLPIFYDQQLDPVATALAAFPARDRAAFFAHWDKIRRDATVLLQTIVADGQVAGNVVSFVLEGRREVGYWLGREFWGRGIATQALAAFVAQIAERPLYACVARHNLASIRVLHKCGFTICGEEPELFELDGVRVAGLILCLAAAPREA